MTLVAGCYERFLFGFNHPDSASAEEPELARSFTHAAHKGVVKSLASAGPFVASGGADDLIHLYDLRTDKDLGFLMNPGEGAISSLRFFTPAGAYSPTHLLSGCSDGTISVWKAGGGWECMKTLRGHCGEISSIAVHPSGCLGLTTSRDGTLKLWDLVKGRVTFSTKIGNDSDVVVFAPSGVKYALQAGSSVVVKPVSAGGSEAHDVKLQHSRRVLSMCFGSGGDDILITGAEDGALRVWDVEDGKELLHIPRAHATRIKALTAVYAEHSQNDNSSKKKSSKGTSSKTNVAIDQVPKLLGTASSDGVIKLWSLREAVSAAVKRGNPEAEDGGESACLCDTNTKARLTTLCAVDPVEVMEVRLREQSETKQIAEKQRKKKQAAEKPPEKKRKASEAEKAGKSSSEDLKRKKEEMKQRPRSGVVRKDGTVSFIEEEDVKRQSKKQRKVQIAAKRKADQRLGQHRRANVPGSKAQ